MGKDTRSSIGYSEYGGGSEEGVIWFNELCTIVVEDRNSCNNAMDAEEWVMLTLWQHKYGDPAQNGKGIQPMLRTESMIQKEAWKGMRK